MILEAQRLLLREMNPEDYDALYAVLADPDIMWHYVKAKGILSSQNGMNLYRGCNVR